jgi:hypothetical protein
MFGTRARALFTLAALVAGATGLLAAPAEATAPVREAYHTSFRTEDFFADAANEPDDPECAFPVIGDWTVDGVATTYLDSEGRVTRFVDAISFEGTFSNPASGKSVPDSGQQTLTFVFDADGSVAGVTAHSVRNDPLLPEALYHVWEGELEVLVRDVGRDWRVANKHPFSIDPLCDALA